MRSLPVFFTMAFLLCGIFAPSVVYADELMENFSFRVTLESDGDVYHWEFDSPGTYEWHHGDKVLHGEKAKPNVEKVFALLDLSEEAEAEELAARLKNGPFPDLERFDIRWRSGESQLYSWVWEKN
ncbi:hypothetical protein [Thalassobacillus sp. C254]|uniref:hypothetical protein n=1 Tax=Thalassobacillus sp. C254 TaxID=1225341 RepID=UPI0006D009C9|nr:hypothetical protein [Thalassobacillus sp. C254]